METAVRFGSLRIVCFFIEPVLEVVLYFGQESATVQLIYFYDCSYSYSYITGDFN